MNKEPKVKGFFQIVFIDGMIKGGGIMFLVFLVGQAIEYLVTKRWLWEREDLLVIAAFCMIFGLCIGFLGGLVGVFRYRAGR